MKHNPQAKTRYSVVVGLSFLTTVLVMGTYLADQQYRKSPDSRAPLRNAAAHKQNVEELLATADKASATATVEVRLEAGADPIKLPVPFVGISDAGRLKGDITQIGSSTTWKVTFPSGVDSEGPLNENKIYLVVSHDDLTIATAQIDEVLKLTGETGNVHNVDYFGYKYTNTTGTLAGAAADERAQALVTPLPAFNVRFKGQFFGSRKAFLQHPEDMANFAASRGITWKKTHNHADTVRFDPSNLYVFVVNEGTQPTQGARITVRNIGPVCGDNVTDTVEACDDGNPANGDGCNEDCSVENGFACTGSPSVCSPVTPPRGNLFVTQSSTPVTSQQLLGGTLANAAMRLNLKAETEDVDVTFLALAVSANGEAVDSLELYKTGETTPFASATVAGCGSETVPPSPAVNFCATLNSQQLVVIKDQKQEVLVRPRMKTDAEGGVSSNELLSIKLWGVQDVAGGYRPVRGKGVTSTLTLAFNDEDGNAEGEVFYGRTAISPGVPNPDVTLAGAAQHVVMSKITALVNANPDADDTNVPSGPERPVGQFKFTAAANTNVQNGLNKNRMQTAIFNVLLQNVTVSGYTAYNKADNSVSVVCTSQPTGTQDVVTVRCDFGGSDVNTEVDPGSDITLVLAANVSNQQVNPAQESKLQVSLNSYGDMNASLGTSPGNSHIEWIDADAGLSIANQDSRTFRWFELASTEVKSTLYRTQAGSIGINTPPPDHCPNGTLEPELGEECDDGNQVDDDDCSNQCKLVVPNPFL